jgi:hypothetical protein
MTQWLRWLLIAAALIHIFYGACNVLQGLVLSAMANGFPSQLLRATSTTANELREGVVGMLLAIVFFGVIVVFATWTYRMNANIHALGSNNLRFTPGWAVGWYFVPIANLWKPYQVVRELWLASNNPAGWQTDRSSKLLSWWWTTWLAYLFFPLVSVAYMMRLSVQGDAFSPLLLIELFGVVYAALGLAAAILAYFVVTRIGASQAQAADRSLSAVFA